MRRAAVFIAMLCIQPVCAQSAQQYISHGDDAMQKGDCYNAAEYYRQGLEKYEFNIEMKFKYAEALRCFNDYKNAAEVYKKVAEEDVTKEYPMAIFWYGSMLRYLGRYDAAPAQFKKFLNRYKGHDYYTQKAQQELEACSWAKANTTKEKSKVIHLPDTINTPYSETNPFQSLDGHFLFSSLRKVSVPKKKETYLARIYIAPADYSSAHVMDVPGDPARHIANGAYNNAKTRFYFTQCEAANKQPGQLRCDLYVSQVKGSTLSAPDKLDSTINLPGYTTTQPNIGSDERGNEVLYFVSDRPGGQGKTDIWMSTLRDGRPEPPTNLGAAVNTIDEEFSPFYDSQTRQLYFASNWHYGYGGLDIFTTTYQNGSWTAPKNLGQAVNSPQNDFYFYKSWDRSKNYFASNRKGSQYIKAETCCNDIWMYDTGEHIDIPPSADSTIAVDTTPVAALHRDTIPATAQVTADTLVSAPHPDRQLDSARVAQLKQLIADTPKTYIDRSISEMKQLLPVTLYFHNDEPECCNLRDTTALNYVETYQSYWRLLDRYKKEFSKGLSAGSKTEAEREVFDLFTQKVDKGYYDLIHFSRQLLDALQSGKKIEITIQGYCSPLNYNLYNIKLADRRIASLKNYFYHYHDGMLVYFMDKGQLVLKGEALGEENAPKSVSDKLEDTRNSVYNPAAALERKVEIVSVEVKR
ncbi:MAG: hypothetical protein JST90_13970 [Bacteroidetes bacterium]|nr:hypothetical protein [Bacteroidota bacterium]